MRLFGEKGLRNMDDLINHSERSDLLCLLYKCIQVDAFSSEPFKGNPAAVLLQDKNSASEMSDETRQKIASEMNLSETSFVELQDGKDSFKTSRWGENSMLKTDILTGAIHLD